MKFFTLTVALCCCLLSIPMHSQAQQKPSSEHEQKALKEAQQIRNELLAGADFSELAQQHSDDLGSAMLGGKLGFMGKGLLVPEYEAAALALSKGDISEPVKTEFGYHIIQLIEIEEGRFNTRHILIKP
ncbi:peptidylprolyl isomerase [Catalinimonas niigatensis]|uniref:peptidylprolyl isomerase n=1 Tax=Catalinimonas niigatensis TaxID=1397264 RepID=UPI0026671C50|nr:peptidylprolyl isomerase [Catalinimonas niigatensis]WPP48316.1 peptidylprolyl isomerase [Catalinimonas niigatensis]